jgi:hypothetical protein
LDGLPFLISLQLVAFGGLLGAFMAAYNIKMLVSEYQSIDMLCIVLSVKFEGGLSILVLRNKQLYKKKRTSKVQKVQISQTPPFEERTDLVKRGNATDRTIRTEPTCVS